MQKSDVEIYPKELTDMLNFAGFSAFWEKMKLHCRTYEEAYEYSEKVFIYYFNHRKYSSYNSFRSLIIRKRKQIKSQ